MKNLTKEERQKIAIEEITELPFETIITVSLLKIAQAGLEINADNIKISTETTLSDKQYLITSITTWKEIQPHA